MAPKPDKKKDSAGGRSKTKDPSAKKSGGNNNSSSNNKAKKKKWSKGKTRDKLNNAVLFDAATYGKLYKEVPNYRLITPAVVSERLRVCVSLAGRALQELLDKGLIRRVVKHGAQRVYTRNQAATTKDGDDEEGH